MDIRGLVNQVDLVDYVEKYTDLTPQGDVFRGVCPICGHDNNTEFVVYDHKTFHCWACHASGDVINFIKDKYSVDFYTAVEKLADELNVDIEHDATYQSRKKAVSDNKEWALACKKNLKTVERYLEERRGLNPETMDYFQLGADSYGNVSIPFIDVNGRYVGHAVRRFEGTPKYLTNKNSDIFTKSEFLYNLRGVKEKLDNRLYMVEGFFCAMSLHQEDRAAVAYNSSQPTKQQLAKVAALQKMYPELTVILVPDNDGIAYGLLDKVRKNILRYASELPVEVLLLPDGVKDVNEFFSMGKTLEEFDELKRVPLDIFVLDMLLAKCDSVLAEKHVVEEYAKTVSDNLTLLAISKTLSRRWEMDEKAVQDFLHVSQIGVALDEDLKDPEQCLAETIKMLKEPVMQYGLMPLDNGIRGAGRRKDVTIVGGCSGSGKTFMTVGMAADMAVRQRKHIIYFSMEMSAGALYERVLGYLLQRSSDVVDQMILEGDSLVYNVLDKLKEYIYVVDKNGLTIQEIDAYVKDANAKKFDGQLDCIFIDYIQYMKGCAEYQVLAETAKGLKPLAKDNNIHVVCLSQLNRGVMPWEKPDMGKLKGGGDIEASADEILLLWRPGKDPALLPEEAEDKKNIVMVGIGKARNGARIEEAEMRLDVERSRIVPIS